jgi:glucose-1-phosphate thymidylyltransferase
LKAYVLAAGYGTRMYPLTRDVPKALLKVGGEPILSHTLRRLQRLDGLSETVVVTNSRFTPRLRAWAETCKGGPLTIVDDGTTTAETRLGALGDLALALERVPLNGENAVVSASDFLLETDLTEAHRTFRARGRTTLLVRPVEVGGGPSPYNEVTTGEDGRVVAFREKPADPTTGVSAIALYFFLAADLERLDEYLGTGSPDAPGHFIAWLVERVECGAVPLTGGWHDVGSMEGLEAARRRFGGDS